MGILQLDYYVQNPSVAPTASATGGAFRIRHRRILPNEKYSDASPEVTDADLNGSLMLTPEGYADVDNMLRDQFEIFDGTDWRIIPTTTTGSVTVSETAIPTTGANAWEIAPTDTAGNQANTGSGNIAFGAIASGNSPSRVWMLLNQEGAGATINSLTFNPFRGTDATKQTANDLDNRLRFAVEGVGSLNAGTGILNTAFNDSLIWSREGTALNRLNVTCARGNFIKCRVTMVNTPAGGSGTSVLNFSIETYADRRLQNISSIYPGWPPRQILISPNRNYTLPVMSAGGASEIILGRLAVSYSNQFAAFNDDPVTLPLQDVADTWTLYLTSSGNYNIIPNDPGNQTFSKPSSALDILTFTTSGSPAAYDAGSEVLLIPATGLPYVTLTADLTGLRCVTAAGAYATSDSEFFGILQRSGIATDVIEVDRHTVSTGISAGAIAMGSRVSPTTDGKLTAVTSGGIGWAMSATTAADQSAIVALDSGGGSGGSSSSGIDISASNEQTLTAAFNLPTNGAYLQVLDPNGADRDVTLNGGGVFHVVNNSDGTNALVLKQGVDTVATLSAAGANPAKTADLIWLTGSSQWYAKLDGGYTP